MGDLGLPVPGSRPHTVTIGKAGVRGAQPHFTDMPGWESPMPVCEFTQKGNLLLHIFSLLEKVICDHLENVEVYVSNEIKSHLTPSETCGCGGTVKLFTMHLQGEERLHSPF